MRQWSVIFVTADLLKAKEIIEQAQDIPDVDYFPAQTTDYPGYNIGFSVASEQQAKKIIEAVTVSCYVYGPVSYLTV